VGTRIGTNELEIRGAGATGGGAINVPGDPNQGLEIAPQSTQGFASLGAAGFNTPSLLCVGYHAPYLHDGSAETLQEVYERHAASADNLRSSYGNGDVELQQLEAFLLSIDDDTEPFNQ